MSPSAYSKVANRIEDMSHAELAKYVTRLVRTLMFAGRWARVREHRFYDAIAERLEEARVALSRIEEGSEEGK